MGRGQTVVLALVALCGCNGVIEEPGFDNTGSRQPDSSNPGSRPGDVPSVPQGVMPLTHMAGLGPAGLTRLSREELRRTHLDLLGIDPGTDLELLPQDSITPFDNDYTTQVPSAALVQGLRAVAERAAERVMQDTQARDRVVGCTPTSADDTACFRSFVETFGRRALRRSLEPSEIDEFAALQRYAVEDGDFYSGVGLVIAAMLMDLEHVYRIEVGIPAQEEGIIRLTGFELASRLSYFLWGTMPDDALLDRALSGGLDDREGARAAAERLLSDDKAAERIARFHALWLGYDTLPHAPAVAASMRAESDALIRRTVLEEDLPWLEIFNATDSYLDDTMAEIYGLPAGEGWRDVSSVGRRGILSHSAFLSAGGKFGDTSPVMRGIFIRERLLCQPIPPAPDDVNADEPPPARDPSDCKEQRYARHRTNADCATCHDRIDPVGFGLENYDREGRFREHDEGRPECTISGEGELADVGMSFVGPAGLADAALATGELDDCMIQHLFQFLIGREPDSFDQPTIESIVASFNDDENRLRQLLVELVSSEAFRFRVIDPGSEQAQGGQE